MLPPGLQNDPRTILFGLDEFNAADPRRLLNTLLKSMLI